MGVKIVAMLKTVLKKASKMLAQKRHREKRLHREKSKSEKYEKRSMLQKGILL